MQSMAITAAAETRRYQRIRLLILWTPLLLLLPVAIELIVFRYVPSLSAIWYSFTNWDGLRKNKFVGLDNYLDLFNDRVFRAAFWNMLVYAVIRTGAMLVMALVAAELVLSVRNERTRMIWKIVFVIPMVVPRAVNYLMWAFIYDPQVGMLNQLLNLVGLGELAQPWLGQSSTALASLAFIGFPFVSTLAFLIFVASLEGVSRDLIETTELEGGSIWQRIFAVDIPMLRGAIIFVTVLLVLECLQTVDPQLILTRGGPGDATELPGYYLYRTAFQFQQFGMACAVGVLMLLVGLVFSVSSIWLRYRGAYDVD